MWWVLWPVLLELLFCWVMRKETFKLKQNRAKQLKSTVKGQCLSLHKGGRKNSNTKSKYTFTGIISKEHILYVTVINTYLCEPWQKYWYQFDCVSLRHSMMAGHNLICLQWIYKEAEVNTSKCMCTITPVFAWGQVYWTFIRCYVWMCVDVTEGKVWSSALAEITPGIHCVIWGSVKVMLNSERLYFLYLDIAYSQIYIAWL